MDGGLLVSLLSVFSVSLFLFFHLVLLLFFFPPPLERGEVTDCVTGWLAGAKETPSALGMDGGRDGWVDAWMDGWTGLIDGWMDGWTHGCTDGRMAGHMDGWMEGCMGGRLARWSDAWMHACKKHDISEQSNFGAAKSHQNIWFFICIQEGRAICIGKTYMF